MNLEGEIREKPIVALSTKSRQFNIILVCSFFYYY